jgi:hypothetical protein
VGGQSDDRVGKALAECRNHLQIQLRTHLHYPGSFFHQ